MRATITAIVLVLASNVHSALASDPAAILLERGFRDTVQPFLKTYCT